MAGQGDEKPADNNDKGKAPASNNETTVAKDAAAAAPNVASAQGFQQLLQQLAISQGAGAPKPEGKKQEDYKFWNTQPVPKFQEPNLLQTTDGTGEGKTLPEGPILPDHICKASAKPEPAKLPDGFVWDLVDLDDKAELQELYDLLYNHYVEDTDGSFRFNYSIEFLKWALKPPGWKKEWHIGVRAKAAEGKKGKLVAFISGVPASLKVRQSKVNAVEINFLTIHRKLRAKRLAPVLIKEVTRQCYRNGIYQALYTAGTLLPTPVTTCRYYHRSLDWPHLYKTGFSHLPHRSTESLQARKYFLPSKTATKGLRPMKPEDVPAVRDLLVRYLDRFHLKQEFTNAEIEHLLCSAAAKDVVWSYVVEQKGKITDFISYYLLAVSPHPKIQHSKSQLITNKHSPVHRPKSNHNRNNPRRLPLLLRLGISVRLRPRRQSPRRPQDPPRLPRERRSDSGQEQRLPRLQRPDAAGQPALPQGPEIRAR
jgi:glycylpeptide N-tetradecanoyltransferase